MPELFWRDKNHTDTSRETEEQASIRNYVMVGDATLWHQRTEYVTVPKNLHDAVLYTNTARRRIISIPIS